MVPNRATRHIYLMGNWVIYFYTALFYTSNTKKYGSIYFFKKSPFFCNIRAGDEEVNEFKRPWSLNDRSKYGLTKIINTVADIRAIKKILSSRYSFL